MLLGISAPECLVTLDRRHSTLCCRRNSRSPGGSPLDIAAADSNVGCYTGSIVLRNEQNPNCIVMLS